MDDDQTPIRPWSGRGSRGLTRLKCLSLRRAAGEKTCVDINVNYGVTSDPNVETFNNYLGVVYHERLSILINSWDEVSEGNQNMLWEDVRVSFTLLSLSYNAF